MARGETVGRDMLRLFRATLLGLHDIAKLCINRSSLHCIDPPVFTTSFLWSRGLDEYTIRRIWRAAAQRSVSQGETIYSHEGVVFRLRPRVEHGVAFHHAGTMTPLDRLDCIALGDECYQVPHCNAFYVYLEGSMGHASIRLNMAYIAAVLARTRPEFLSGLLDFADRIVESPRSEAETVALLLDSIVSMLRSEQKLLGLFMPLVPRSLEELLHVSPIARSLYSIILGSDREGGE